MNKLITAGELAKLSGTTKRTIQFYHQKGVLKPIRVNASNYRLYEERQVLEYQMILLLSTLGVRLEEIRGYLRRKNDLSKLFNNKKLLIKNQIERLQFNLENMEKYLLNLKSNETMVDPKIKHVKPFKVYFIEKIGAYSNIGKYCQQLIDMFKDLGENFTTLTIFEDSGYRPKKCRMKICAIARAGMKLKKEYISVVKKMTFFPGKVISYTYRGPGEMLSLFWKELEKYCRLKNHKIRTVIPDYEIYWEVNENPVKQRFEIFLPIE